MTAVPAVSHPSLHDTMPNARTIFRTAVLTAAVALPITSADAQRWVPLAHGEWGYELPVLSSGAFACGIALVGGSCATSLNTLTLTSVSGSMTLAFVGFNQSVLATNQAQQVQIGRIDATFTGDFAFPLGSNPNVPVFTLRINAPGGAFGLGYRGRPTGQYVYDCCEGFATYTAVGTTRPFPPNANYPAVVFHSLTAPTFTRAQARYDVAVTYGLVPEPSSLALAAAGLGALGLAGAWRRRAVASA